MCGKLTVLLFVGLVVTFIISCDGGKMTDQPIRFANFKDVPDAGWKSLSEKRIYFGHQSVGKNIIKGIEDLKKKNPQIKLSIAETTSPMEVTQGILAHTGIGMNGDPKSKIQAFADFMGT